MLFLLTDAISTAALESPDGEAIVCRNERITYRQLEQRTNQLGRALTDQGVQPGDRVGIYLDKGLETPIAIYGIMKAGAAYVPLDPGAPSSQLDRIIKDARIRHLVTAPNKRRGLVQLLAESDSPIEALLGAPPLEGVAVRQVTWREIGLADSSPPTVSAIDQDLAYILYEDGSAHDLKGIMHTHASVLSYAKWARDVYDLRSEDRLTNHAPLHSNLSTFDFFASAITAATTVIVGDEYLRLPSSYARLLEESKITTCLTRPYALTQLLVRGAIDQRDLSALRWMIFSGDRFPPSQLSKMMEALPHTRFSHLYGPAEINGCTFYHIPRPMQQIAGAIPIGKAWRNADTLIVDAKDQLLTDDTPGELLVRSSTIMQGYWNRPDLNKRAFAQLAGTEEHPHYYYCTGNLVQQRPDGNLSSFGSKDRQIPTPAGCVMLDEVEDALLTLPHIEEAAAFAVPGEHNSLVIHAAVALSPEGGGTSVGALLSKLKDVLPAHAIPIKLTTEMTFPRTTNGEIDRRELAKRAT